MTKFRPVMFISTKAQFKADPAGLEAKTGK